MKLVDDSDNGKHIEVETRARRWVERWYFWVVIVFAMLSSVAGIVWAAAVRNDQLATKVELEPIKQEVDNHHMQIELLKQAAEEAKENWQWLRQRLK